MNIRLEAEGVHFYDRVSGQHILFDEVEVNNENLSIAPRHLSLAITNECDLSCPYCYVDLANKYMSKSEVILIANKINELGAFDISIGGGEPLLHPDIGEICERIWSESKLGINITTHGHHLSEQMIQDLEGNVSIIRVSVDGVEPIYSKFRGRKLSDLRINLLRLKGRIPLGINTVVNKSTLPMLDEVKRFSKDVGAIELLLLPMMRKGRIVLSDKEIRELENWIDENKNDIPIRISRLSSSLINVNQLFESEDWFDNYAFISAEKELKRNSFEENGVKFETTKELEDTLNDWHLKKVLSLKRK